MLVRATLSISCGAKRRQLMLLLNVTVHQEEFSQNTIDVGLHRQDFLACGRDMRGNRSSSVDRTGKRSGGIFDPLDGILRRGECP